MRLGLALSGGGLRATLFHLGVVKALQQHGSLRDVKHITSVSGGSILAAHLVKNWDSYLDARSFDAIAQEIIRFARLDVRGRIFRRLMLPQYYLLPYLENLRHRRIRREGTVRNLLFERYLKKLLGDGTLDQLAVNPDAPKLDILTTNLTRGSLAYFASQTFVANNDKAEPVSTRISVPRAVMASALFPAVFPTIEFNAENLLAEPANLFPQPEYFTDGGVYDNLGIRRFQTVLRGENCPVDNVLVCDASGAFDWLVERENLSYWQTALRSTDILMKRLADLEYHIALTQPNHFTFVRITDRVEPSGDHELSKFVQQQVKNVRTDLDQFTITEIDCIVQHGYSVAARKVAELYKAPPADSTPWRPFPKRKRPPESQAIRRLQRARLHSKNLFRRNDWPSYVYPAFLLMLLFLGWRWYDRDRFDRYYNTLPTEERAITEQLREPLVALRQVKAAIAQSAAAPETRLRVALLTYSLMLMERATQDVLDSAINRLAQPERKRFEEARWAHFYTPLKKSTFGTPTLPDLKKAIRFVDGAIPYVSPNLQVETALTSYGVMISKDAKNLTEPAFEQWRRSLESLDKTDAEKQLNDVNHYRARLLKGHYLLETGNRAKSKPREAEEWFRKAADAYKEARTVSIVGDYWKVEFNTCNSLYAAAGAAQKHRNTIPISAQERHTVEESITQTVNDALTACQKAQELAPPKFWQPTYVTGLLLAEKHRYSEASTTLLRGYWAAQIEGEQEAYTGAMMKDPQVIQLLRPLCPDRQFNRTFVRSCRS